MNKIEELAAQLQVVHAQPAGQRNRMLDQPALGLVVLSEGPAGADVVGERNQLGAEQGKPDPKQRQRTGVGRIYYSLLFLAGLVATMGLWQAGLLGALFH